MNNTQLCICGIGPGSSDYILPLVFSKVKDADVLIGGKRHLDIFSGDHKLTCVFDGQMIHLKNSIAEHDGKKMVVLVSGDTGFHSLRRYIKAEFPQLNIEVIPGISSFQYLYAKLGLGYENAFLASMHGAEVDFLDKVNQHSSVFLLTDKKNTWKSIAQQLVNNGMGHFNMHVGERLSYADEKIISGSAQEISTMNEDFSLCSVLIEKEENNERY